MLYNQVVSKFKIDNKSLFLILIVFLLVKCSSKIISYIFNNGIIQIYIKSDTKCTRGIFH